MINKLKESISTFENKVKTIEREKLELKKKLEDVNYQVEEYNNLKGIYEIEVRIIKSLMNF